MRRLAQQVLRALARRVIERYRPQVVGITGSYGKTSTKEAINAVLAEAYNVRSSAKSFNNEFGVPFTILNVPPDKSGGLSVLIGVWSGLRYLLARQPYPTILVLEMGADRPGDVQAIVNTVSVHVGVLTSIGPTHLQRFGTVDAVLAEKSILATSLHEHGWAVLNGDDPRVRSLGEVSTCRVVSYGFQSGVAVRCVDAAPGRGEGDEGWGMLIKVEFGKEKIPVFLAGVTGRHSTYAALAAIACGIAYHMDIVEIAEGLRHYQPPPGRMRVLNGIKQTVLIDDTYNSSPDACVAAIEGLREFPCSGKRYAVLGDMADLGSATEAAHRAIGKTIVDEEIDVLVAVGEMMRDAAREAGAQGMSTDRIFTFPDPLSASKFVQNRLDSEDVVLIKGSQVTRMEKAVKELMTEPERAAELLVRQGPGWLRT